MIKNNYVDFLFVYEIKAREVENDALIAYELRKRGYSCAFVNTWKSLEKLLPKKISCKVAIISAAYNTAVVDFMLRHVKKCDKIVNLQWEQLLSIGQKDNPQADYYIQGKGEYVVHVSWGPDNYDRLIHDCGLNHELVKKIGHVGMDFLRDEFEGYYKSREQLLDNYSIPKDKKVCLFLSSFSYVNIPERYIDYVGDEFVDISIDSQKVILDWICNILKEREDIVFIYRPHPAEAQNPDIINLANNTERLFVISDFSVKQWIRISDQIYNWYSTSLMEIFSSNKNCFMLRPVDMPRKYEISIFENGRFVTSYEEFKKTIDINNYFPYSEEHMKKYYYYDEIPTYIKLGNMLEEVYKNDKYSISEDMIPPYILSKRAIFEWTLIGKLYKRVKTFIGENLNKTEAIKDSKYYRYEKQLKKQNYVSNSEFNKIIERIDNILG